MRGDEMEISTHLTVEISVSAIYSTHHGGALTFLLATVVAGALELAFLAKANVILFGGHGQREIRVCWCLKSVRESVRAHRGLKLALV